MTSGGTGPNLFPETFEAGCVLEFREFHILERNMVQILCVTKYTQQDLGSTLNQMYSRLVVKHEYSTKQDK